MKELFHCSPKSKVSFQLKLHSLVPVVSMVPRFRYLPAVPAKRGADAANAAADAGARAALAGRLVQKLLCENRHRNAQAKSRNFTQNGPILSSLSYPPGEIALRLPELDTALVLVVRPDHLQTSFNSHRSSCINLKTFRILS